MANKEYYSKKLLAAVEGQDILAVQELVTELNSLSVSERKTLKVLYAKIEEDLFDIGLEPPMNYDLNGFVLGAVEGVAVKKTGKSKAEKFTKKVKEVKDIDSVFIEFYNNSGEVFSDLKYHFFFHLNNPSYEEVGMLILTDDILKDSPLVDKIVKDNEILSPQKFTITSFLELVKKTPTLIESQYLMLLVTSPTYGDASAIKTQLEELFENFTKGSIIKVKSKTVLSKDDYVFGVLDNHLYDEIGKITSNFLNNKAISHEEEKIIKIALGSNTAITDYKILKAGFSGAKVVEVRPIRYTVKQVPVRFVIKFADKNRESKLYRESELFKRCVEEFRIQDYSCTYVETEQCEAIKYNYASSDSIIDSHSLASLIDDSLSEMPKHSHSLTDSLRQLFLCPIFAKWSELGGELSSRKVRDLYKWYIDEDKTLAWISRLDEGTEEQVRQSLFWKKFQKILNEVIRYKEKICHGDLHSENLFKDKHDVYLIDFGYTTESHAVIDHTTLEASIKFKHMPFYIPLDELIEIEKKLFDKDAFTTSFDLSFIKRPQVKALYELILLIRQNGADNFTNGNNNLDYFISLFVLTVRQIQYKDLNQRYAWESAKILADYIEGHL